MPPAYVKPYVKRGKTDAADAEAICEAVRRPTMRFVPVKSEEQQAALSMHRTRDLTPLQKSSGGKERLGRISKMGDRYLRKLLVVGMTAVVRNAKRKPEAVDPNVLALLARKPARVVTVALANKTARIVWAIMARGEVYRARHVPALAA
jgi:transposase